MALPIGPISIAKAEGPAAEPTRLELRVEGDEPEVWQLRRVHGDQVEPEAIFDAALEALRKPPS